VIVGQICEPLITRAFTQFWWPMVTPPCPKYD